jgi:hypothetical protein
MPTKHQSSAIGSHAVRQLILTKQQAFEQQERKQQEQEQELEREQQQDQPGQQRRSLTAPLLPGSRSDLGSLNKSALTSADGAWSKALPLSVRVLHALLYGHLHTRRRTGAGSGSRNGEQRRRKSAGAGWWWWCRRMFVGLVWGGLAVAVLYGSVYSMLDAIRMKEIPASNSSDPTQVLRPHLTKEEQQEFLCGLSARRKPLSPWAY